MKKTETAVVENATNIRKRFLRIMDGKKTHIISKDSAARSVLMPVEVYEKLISGEKEKLPSLAVLGARFCGREKALETARAVSAAGKYFSKIIFVCGEKTEKYAEFFKAADVRAVSNGKPEMPIITSLKLAVTALSSGDDFLVFCFLSKSASPAVLRKMAAKISVARKKKKGIVITKVKGRASHPVAMSKKYFKMLLSTRKELGIPYIIRKFKKDIIYA
ncbi:MAG: NTP transferase domain-containing protein [Elusimicrobiota bacterium]|nr:NTP transferase domain-containing protein [Elusimicrobiota bacterium]